MQDELSAKHEHKLKDVKYTLKVERGDSLKDLMLVDAIQRLGIDHHFQEEIEAVLWRKHMSKNCFDRSQSLYDVSLCFRLLRQEGYYVPPGWFLLPPNSFIPFDNKNCGISLSLG